MARSIEFQEAEYIYELENCAKEHGFKTDEGWQISLASDDEKFIIEKGYHPTLSAKAQPPILLELLGLVKDKLSIPKSQLETTLDERMLTASRTRHIIAFNIKRPR